MFVHLDRKDVETVEEGADAKGKGTDGPFPVQGVLFDTDGLPGPDGAIKEASTKGEKADVHVDPPNRPTGHDIGHTGDGDDDRGD